MDFDFSDDQEMLRDSVRKWVARGYDFERRKTIVKAGGFSREAWGELAELGLMGLYVPEAHGGMGFGPVEAMVVMEELGRGLVLEPYAQGGLIASAVLSTYGDDGVRDEWLPKIASGDALVVLGHQERAARYKLNHVTGTATKTGTGWTVNAAKSIVPARVSGADDDASGIALFLVARDASGVDARGYPTQDGGRAAEVVFSNADATLIAAAGTGEKSGFAALEHAVDIGIGALCAEAVGAMDSLVKVTAEYMNTRKQFGVAIASFQALRHRIADVKMQLELARSMSFFASLKLNEPAPARRRAMAQAKMQLGQSMRFVGQQCIQLHGGIGVTEEYIASHFFKRLTVMEMTFGDTGFQLGEVSRRMTDTAGVFA
ncbi:MAG: acyl-CoA dehydrogenase [Rhizobacter sp.]|nr:acyl-CoA dehydrogenase [Rhizobacter sp.]